MAEHYNEKLDEDTKKIQHLLIFHLSQTKLYQLLNLKSLTEDIFELWVEGLSKEQFVLTDCRDAECLWNIKKAPH